MLLLNSKAFLRRCKIIKMFLSWTKNGPHMKIFDALVISEEFVVVKLNNIQEQHFLHSNCIKHLQATYLGEINRNHHGPETSTNYSCKDDYQIRLSNNRSIKWHFNGQ